VAGDFNAHHKSWHCAKNNASGNTLHRLVEDQDLHVLNSLEGVGPTRPASGSSIDLFLTSAPHLVDSFDVLAGSTLVSDHLPLSFSLAPLRPTGSAARASAKQQERYNLRKADWPGYQASLRASLTSWLNAAPTTLANPQFEIDTLALQLATAIGSAADLHIPRSKPRRAGKPWFTRRVQQAHAKFRLAARHLRRRRSPASIEVCKRARKRFQRLARQEKRRVQERQYRAIEQSTTKAVVWSAYNRVLPRQSSALAAVPDLSGRAPNSPSAAVNNLASHFARCFQQHTLPARPPTGRGGLRQSLHAPGRTIDQC